MGINIYNIYIYIYVYVYIEYVVCLYCIHHLQLVIGSDFSLFDPTVSKGICTTAEKVKLHHGHVECQSPLDLGRIIQVANPIRSKLLCWTVCLALARSEGPIAVSWQLAYWQYNLAMENGPIVDDLPFQNDECP